MDYRCSRATATRFAAQTARICRRFYRSCQPSADSRELIAEGQGVTDMPRTRSHAWSKLKVRHAHDRRDEHCRRHDFHAQRGSRISLVALQSEDAVCQRPLAQEGVACSDRRRRSVKRDGGRARRRTGGRHLRSQRMRQRSDYQQFGGDARVGLAAWGERGRHQGFDPV